MAEPLWGGRFSEPPDPEMLRLTRSIDVDIRLLPHDLEATKAHARVLADAGLLTAGDVDAIDRACDEIASEWSAGTLTPAALDEDVHTLVERELTDRLGDTGARVHAGRSRNDLVAQDLRLWCAEAAGELSAAVAALVEVLADRAEEHAATVMPGYTHLQRAQPVTLGFHLAAHASALVRDHARLRRARDEARTCVLGAGALAGTTLPLDAAVAARALGLPDLFLNAMDAVSDRDFACDLVYASTLCGVHLSRLAEDVVVFSSAEFGFFRLPDAWSTGSSIMPQKRNPDVAELVRGRAAGGIGDLVALLSMLKGLPLAYDRDLQEDKEAVFTAVDRLRGCLAAMTGLMGSIGVDAQAMATAAGGSGSWATDAAEELVLQGTPFRHAHARVGAAVASGTPAPFDPAESVRSRRSHGGTSPERVLAQVEALRAAVR
ncbi:MAG TPA: argininosuccinate lyase [Actinomycetota bacterium]|nr:argininosuccinate lyase [Actinomycetota bacterium]